MEEYFYLDGNNQQKGPIASSDLLKYGVTKHTLVWRNGMNNWQAAAAVPELAALFVESKEPSTPPVPPIPPVVPPTPATPPTPPTPVTPTTQKPDNLLVWSILTTVLCCLPLGVVAIVYSNKVDTLWNSGKYTEAENAAKSAKLFCFLSLGGGVLAFIIAFFAGLLGAIAGA